MELIKGESDLVSRYRLFRVRKSYILFERKLGQKMPFRMRIFNSRGNQELNTKNPERIAGQLKTIGELYSDIDAGKKPKEDLAFVSDYNDPDKTAQIILEAEE